MSCQETFLLDLNFELSDNKENNYVPEVIDIFDEIFFNIYYIIIDGEEGWAIDF